MTINAISLYQNQALLTTFVQSEFVRKVVAVTLVLFTFAAAAVWAVRSYFSKQVTQVTVETPQPPLTLRQAKKAFKEAISNNRRNPWNSKDVNDAADKYLKASLKRGYSVLKKIESGQLKLNEKSKEQILRPLKIYEVLEKGLVPSKKLGIDIFPTPSNAPNGRQLYNHLQTAKRGTLIVPQSFIDCCKKLEASLTTTPKSHTALFYKLGAIQNGWKLLNETYLSHLRQKLPELT